MSIVEARGRLNRWRVGLSVVWMICFNLSRPEETLSRLPWVSFVNVAEIAEVGMDVVEVVLDGI